jgi:hypothetical protein
MLDKVDDCGFLLRSSLLQYREKYYETVLHHWNGADDKTVCFDFGILIAIEDIENELRGDVATKSYLGEFVMRSFVDLSDIWSEVIMTFRLRIYDYDLDNNWTVGSTFVVGHSTTGIFRLSLPL